jgi:hypothetical protein
MRRMLFGAGAAIVLALGTPLPAQAQQPPAPLERFVAQVMRHWESGDASALARLAPADGRITIELGSGAAGSVQAWHAAAALRSLFGSRETLEIEPVRITVSGGEPLRGFGELAWVSRSRGLTNSHRSTIYVGTVWESGGWRIREIRLLR